MYINTFFFRNNMEIKKCKLEENEYIFIEKIKIGFYEVYRCIGNLGENIFIRKQNNDYKVITNKIILKISNLKYSYNIKTDICESDNEK